MEWRGKSIKDFERIHPYRRVVQNVIPPLGKGQTLRPSLGSFPGHAPWVCLKTPTHDLSLAVGLRVVCG